MKHLLPIVASVSFACGGRIEGGVADTGTDIVKTVPCTQATCASLVSTLASRSFDISGDGVITQVTGLFVGGGYIYVSSVRGCDSSFCATLLRVPISGGGFETASDMQKGEISINAIVADDANVYWSTGLHGYRRAHTGGPPVVLTGTDACGAIFVDASVLVCAIANDVVAYGLDGSGKKEASKLAVAPGVLRAGRIFGNDCASSALGAGDAIVAGYGTVADDAACYTLRDGDLVAFPIGGDPPKVLAAGNGDFDGTRMMIDSAGIYLRRAAAGNLIRVAANGGAPVDLTTDMAIAYAITSNAIYWLAANGNNLQIKSMPKVTN